MLGCIKNSYFNLMTCSFDELCHFMKKQHMRNIIYMIIYRSNAACQVWMIVQFSAFYSGSGQTMGPTDLTPGTALPVGVWNACVEFEVSGTNGSQVTCQIWVKVQFSVLLELLFYINMTCQFVSEEILDVCKALNVCTTLYCTILYGAILYYTVPHCTTLYCTVLYHTVLYHTVPYCTTLYCTVLYRTVPHCTVPYCTTLYRTILYCTIPYCTLTYHRVPYCTVPCCSGL